MRKELTEQEKILDALAIVVECQRTCADIKLQIGWVSKESSRYADGRGLLKW